MVAVWSKPALESLSEVLDYTYETFGKKQVPIISDKIAQTVGRLQMFPLSSAVIPRIEGRNLRMAVVVSTLKILYEVKRDTILIHFIWNSNMDIDSVLDRISTT